MNRALAPDLADVRAALVGELQREHEDIARTRTSLPLVVRVDTMRASDQREGLRGCDARPGIGDERSSDYPSRQAKPATITNLLRIAPPSSSQRDARFKYSSPAVREDLGPLAC